jgi:MipA family protein
MVSRIQAAMRCLPAGACIGLLSAFPASVMAADIDQKEAGSTALSSSEVQRYDGIRGKLHEWDVLLGAGVMYAPKFEGSDEFKAVPVPFVSATFAGRVHVGGLGVTVDVYETDGLSFGVKGGIEMGRDEDDSDDLRGLGDVDTGGVISGIVGYKIGMFEFSAAIDKAIGGSDGLTGTVGAKASHMYGRFLLSAGASATWADDNHMDAFFGVNAAQSARSDLDEFDAEAGFKRVDIEASVGYLLTENWTIHGQVGVGLLVGDTVDSPIVKEEIQPSVLLGVGYKF